MDYKIIKDYSKINIDKWSEFIYKHPDGNIFQTPEMFKIYINTDNYEPIILSVVKSNGDLLGILLAVIQKEFKGLLGSFTARSIIFYGPLVIDDDVAILDFLLKEYDRIVKRKVIYSQLRNLKNWSGVKNIYTANGFVYKDHLNILVNLNQTEDQLWKEVHSKRRNEIRRAKKEGTTFTIKNEINDLHECYAILESVYKRAKLPIPSFSYFENMYVNTNKNFGLKLFCAENENKIIGCMLALVYKKTIYDSYAGAYSEYYKKYPNDLIPWEIFLWGKENGYENFDFGGAGKPDIPYGVRDYKKKFGGRLVNYGRFEKIHKPLLFKIGKIGLTFWKNIK